MKRKTLGIFIAMMALVFMGCPSPTASPPADQAITSLAIPGLTPPAMGQTPVAIITATAQYTGTVVWSPAVTTTFAAATVYTATITLTPKAGYTLTGVAANSFTVAGATSVANQNNSGVVTARFPPTGDVPPTAIDIAAIPGVTAPALGATPVASITATAQYTGTVTWTPAVATTFAAATVYTATITLTAKTGYTLTGVAANLFTVAGATSATNPSNSGVVMAAFPATVAVVTIAAIPVFTAPVAGATPVTTITATSQYTGTVAWSGAPVTFALSTVYTATITLSPKAGYTLTGVAANLFTVAGATSATNPSNSGVVTAPFPATPAVAPTKINIAAIPGVTAPVTGATPVTTTTATSQYTGTVAWSPAVTTTFAAATVYTATIKLTAKDGYTLTGVAANSFTAEGAKATNAANFGTVLAEFRPTSSALDYDSSQVGVLKYVPTGSFQRDATAANISMIATAFRLSTCEITRAQCATVLGYTDSGTSSSDASDPVLANWYYAIAFCNKLSIAEGLTPVYEVKVGGTPVNFTSLIYTDIPIASNADWDKVTVAEGNNGYRLPTEMEWEWAAMGATSDRSNGYTGTGTNTKGYTKGYAGSTEVAGAQANIGNYAWYRTNSSGKSHPAGTKLPNELGLCDMSGNVFEWNWDWYGTYGTGTLTSGTKSGRGPDSGSGRVTRGGSYPFGPEFCPISSRHQDTPCPTAYTLSSGGFGFRVVRP